MTRGIIIPGGFVAEFSAFIDAWNRWKNITEEDTLWESGEFDDSV